MTCIRRHRLLAVVLALALSAPAAAIPLAEARHLLSRTGFGVSPPALLELESLDFDSAVAQIVDGVRLHAAVAPPDWVDEPPLTHLGGFGT